jgi:transposase-like protein
MERVEVIARTERRRQWTVQEKVELLAETDVPGSSVTEVARRHGIAESVLYDWRAKRKRAAKRAAALTSPEFVPIGVVGRAAMVATTMSPTEGRVAKAGPPATRPTMDERPGVIEIDLLDGARVRVDAFVDERALRRVLRVLKGDA